MPESNPFSAAAAAREATVLTLEEINRPALLFLLQRLGLELVEIPAGGPVPGSFWGEAEAGLVGDQLLARPDTPIHSILHETGHYICMDPGRRRRLHTDAGGDYDEENAVCYLQILLADYLPEMGQARMLQDMDRWGYSFRLGSARAWFEQDADDARDWLIRHRLIDDEGCPNWTRRGQSAGHES